MLSSYSTVCLFNHFDSLEKNCWGFSNFNFKSFICVYSLKIVLLVSVVKSSLSHKYFLFASKCLRYLLHFRVQSTDHLSETVSLLMQVFCAINFSQHFWRSAKVKALPHRFWLVLSFSSIFSCLRPHVLGWQPCTSTPSPVCCFVWHFFFSLYIKKCFFSSGFESLLWSHANNAYLLVLWSEKQTVFSSFLILRLAYGPRCG